MFNWIAKLFEDANGLPDDGRVAAFFVVITFCANSLASVYMSASHAFDAQQFGIGAGAMIAGVGALFGLRKDN